MWDEMAGSNVIKNKFQYGVRSFRGLSIQSLPTGLCPPAAGIKVIAKNGWFAARPSGTEEIYKIYAESFLGQDHLRRIQAEAQTIVSETLASSARAAAGS